LAVDIDLWLYQVPPSTTPPLHSDLGLATPEQLTAVLAPGSYQLRIKYEGFVDYTDDASRRCPTVEFELAIAPLATLTSAVQSDPFNCIGSSMFPSMPLASFPLYWDSVLNGSQPYQFVPSTNVNTNTGNVLLLQRYRLHLPELTTSPLYYLETMLGVDFLTAGSYGVMLRAANDSIVVGSTLDSLDCVMDSTCQVGLARYQNERFLKRLVASGDYDLWLYERPRERVAQLSTALRCVPFTFSLRIEPTTEKPSYLTCPVEPLPAKLSTEIATDGWNFAEDVLLDIDHRVQVLQVQLPARSAIRVLVDGGSIDMDARIRDVAKDTTIASGFRVGPEGLYAEVFDAGLYNISVNSFGTFTDSACRTYRAAIAIDTEAHMKAVSFCNATTAMPNLSGLATLPFNLEGGITYQTSSNSTLSEVLVLNQTFDVTSTTLFYAKLEHNFLIGPFTVWLRAYNASGRVQRAIEQRDGVLLTATLTPGTYGFELRSGRVQSSGLANVTFLPTCAQFRLEVHAHVADPVSLTDQSQCWQRSTIPKTLDSPAFLGTKNSAHIGDKFKIQFPGSGSTYSEVMHIGPIREASLFRVVTQGHQYDIDIALFDRDPPTGIAIASSVRFDNDEESILTTLAAGGTYSFKVTYYQWNAAATNMPCDSYHLELAVIPLSALAPPTPMPGVVAGTCVGGDVSLPSAPVVDPVAFDQAFSFSQRRAATTSLSLNLTLTRPSVLRADLEFNFARHHLNLRLYSNTSDEPVARSIGNYDGNELLPLTLAPGSYRLAIEELSAQTNGSLLSCAVGRVRVATRELVAAGTTVAVDDQTVALLRCTDSIVPPAFDNVIYMSPRQGKTMHISRFVLADTTRRSDFTDFTLTEAAIFRLRVPRHDELDVDLVLYSGSSSNRGMVIRSRSGFADDSFLERLSAGQYTVEFVYHRRLSASSAACLTFPFEASIEPVSRLQALAPLQQVCTTPTLPQITLGAAPINVSLPHDLSAVTALRGVVGSFNVSVATYLEVDVQYDFTTGPLNVELMATLPRGSTNRTISTRLYPSMGSGRALLQQVLLPGQYVLTLSDVEQVSGATSTAFSGVARCSPALITASSRTDRLPTFTCYGADKLPANTFSYESWVYGGPQNTVTGALRFLGDNFLLDHRETPDDQYMLFNIKTPSYVRFFISAGRYDDIDIFLYRNQSENDLIGTSTASGETESGLFFLQPQAEPYMLDLYFFAISDAAPCRRFTLEMAIRPSATVHNELLCPVPLPNEATHVPPQTIVLDSARTIGNDSYFFTSEHITRNTSNTWFESVFRYRMRVSAPTGATMRARVGFDFLANNYQLELIDASNDLVVVRSTPRATDERSTYVNFGSFLRYDLAAGKQYYLDLIEDTTDKALQLGNVTYCSRFSFQLTADNVGGVPPAGVQPHALWVYPSQRDEINPLVDLVTSIYLSDAVVYNAGTDGASFDAMMRARNVAYLTVNGSSGAVLVPYAALSTSLRRITLTWNATQLALATTYSLHLALEQLRTVNGTAFARYTDDVTYTTMSCSCNGHGSCVAQDNEYTCSCVSPYTGEECLSCVSGYHGAGSACVPDVPCTPTTCNGHGTCQSVDGVPNCQCDRGFGTTGDAWCSRCQPGFIAYPNCTALNNNLARSTRCDAPLLPGSLDGVAFLGYIDRVHLSDAYYIDLLHTEHSIRFTLKRESVFRAYAERHQVDIDIWLYAINPTDGEVLDVVQRGIGVDTEESMFEVLPPGTYELRFEYFDYARWTDDFGDGEPDDSSAADAVDCQSFQFELAITPTASLASHTAVLKANCKATDVVPFTTLASPLRITGPMQYTPTQLFSVVSQPDGRLNRDAPHYFVTLPIIVDPPVNEGQVAVLRVDVGARFLLGDVAVLLEHGSDDLCRVKTARDDMSFYNSTRKRQWGDYDDDGRASDVRRCVSSVADYDTNSLEIRLAPGNYTLFLYEPRPQNQSLSACAVYDLSMRVTYITETETVFNCDGVPVPSSLMTPSYMATTDGYLQLQDVFQLRGARSTQFELANSSLMRVRASGPNGDRVTFSLRNRTTLVTAGVWRTDGSIYAQLPAGNYTLTSTYFGSTTDRFCLALPVEWSIEPYTAVPVCAESLPSFTINAIPFKFADGARYTISSTQANVFRSFPFDVTSLSEINAAIDSDFLRADFRVVLMHRDVVTGTLTQSTEGLSQYNRNTLRAILAPGSYTLQLVQPVRSTATNGPPYAGCMPFNFQVRIDPLVVNGAVGDCFARIGNAEELPTTLDSERYLAGGARSRVHFQSQHFLVPRDASNATTSFVYRHRINFTAPLGAASLFRIFIERHEIDIDVSLLTKAGAVVGAGEGHIVGEETFTADLTAGASYYLELSFWRSSFRIYADQCPTFAMAVEFEPRAPLLPRQCLNGGDHLPPLPSSTLTLPYDYDSRTLGESLYLQQRADNERSVEFEFTIGESADVFFSVAYDFMHGDLSLALESEEQRADTRYGINLRDRNVIIARNIPAGTYTLTIYEPVAISADLLGCNQFVFEAHVRAAYDAAVRGAQPLPPSLAGVAYLGGSSVVHLSGKRLLIERLKSSSTTVFTVAVRSLVRVATGGATLTLTQVQPLQQIAASVANENGESMLAAVIEPGNYTLTLRSRAGGFSFFSAIEGEIELAIVPVDTVVQANQANARTTCAAPPTIEPPTPNAAGTYHARYYAANTTLPAAQAATQSVLHSVAVMLQRQSVVFVRVGFWFPAYALQVRLRGNGTSSSYGVVGRNLNTVNVVLPAGTYTMQIDQPALPPGVWQQTPGLLAPCAAYDVSITIGDAEDSGDYTDCSDFVTLPTSLNSYGGAVRSYGSPLDAQGRLTLWGDKFYMTGSDHGRDSMTLTVAKPSVVSIFTSNDAYTAVDASVSRDGGSAPLAPRYESMRRDEMQHIFYLQQPALYAVELTYNNLLSAPCQFLAVQVLVRPFDELQQGVMCAKGATTAAKLPPAELGTPLATANTYSVSAATRVTPALMAQYVDSRGNFRYGMNFTVTGQARLVASLAFNSLVSGFALELVARNSMWGYLAETRGATKPTEGAGAGVGGATLVSTLEHDLYPGDYQLRVVSIKQNYTWTLGLPFDVDVDHELCFPFLFQLQLAVPGVVTVRVDPPGAVEQTVEQALIVTLTFSGDVFDANSAPVQRIGRGNPLLTAVYLSGPAGATLEASSVDIDTKAGTWRLTFQPSAAHAGQSFVLKVKPNTLYSEDHKPIDLGASLPAFAFASNKCSSHGTYQNGACVCTTGWTGSQCDVCDNDYKMDAGGNCVRQMGGTCRADSCGCQRGSGGPTCRAVGVCSVVNNKLSCTCPANVDPATNCQHCRAGFRNFPTCSPCVANEPCTDDSTPAPPTQFTTSTRHDGSSTPPASESVTNGAPDGGSSTGTIVGVAVGVVLLLVAVGVGYYFYRRNKSRYRRVGAGNFGLDDDEDLTLEAHPMDLSKANANKKKTGGGFADFDL
jgi:hypothetical protein